MKSLTTHKFSMAMNIVFVTCLAFAAHGSANVFDDAVFWFRGGKDCVTQDGFMQQGEFFDDLHANDASHTNHWMSMSSSGYYAGGKYATLLENFKKNAELKTETVVFPALGANIVKEMQVLHISDVGVPQGGKTWFYPFSVNPRSIFARYSISNEYTIVSRIRLDNLERVNYIFKIGYNENDKQGLKLGFMQHPISSYSGTYKCLGGFYFAPNGGRTSFQLRDLPVPTNTWIDVAVVVGKGNLRIGVAAPQALASNNPTIGFADYLMWTDKCELLDSDESYCLFCPENITTYAQADKECFLGSVQQMAIWGRALSDKEVMAAFGMPRPAIFRTGFDNGNSNEFGGTRSGVTQTIDGLGSWQGIWDTMLAEDVWTVNFKALRDEAGLAQIFSLRSLPSSASANIEVALNGTSLGTRRVQEDARVFWPVVTNLVVEGANTLTIRRTDSGAGSFLMDAMELGGALGVGRASHSIDDGRVYPERIATGVPSTADPNPAHWSVGLRPYLNNNTNLRFRVWVDPDVVGVSTSRFWTCVNRYASENHTVAGDEEFDIYVNDTYKRSCKGETSWEDISIGFGKGELRGGWNDFEIRAKEAYETCHWLFDRYRFETVLPRAFSIPPPGMVVIFK